MTISLKNLLIESESGVVWLAWKFLLSYEILTVEINPDFISSFVYKSNNKVAIVVFPFVPVTPIKFNFEDGLSK